MDPRLADRLHRVCRDSALGEAVVFRPVGGAQQSQQLGTTKPLRGVYVPSEKVARTINDLEVITYEPTLGLRLADLVRAPKDEDRFEIGGKTLYVSEVRNPTTGWVKCFLVER